MEARLESFSAADERLESGLARMTKQLEALQADIRQIRDQPPRSMCTNAPTLDKRMKHFISIAFRKFDLDGNGTLGECRTLQSELPSPAAALSPAAVEL